MRAWLEKHWKPLIGYVPIVARLLKEWYCFHFLSSSDLESIFNKHWVLGRSFLALHRWYLGFNLLKNTPSNNLIWVKLPSLPLELWSKETLAEIGNAIGRCVYVDSRCLGEKDKCVAWILIDKSFRGGFPDHIDISWGDFKICQRLDFWGVPFRCSACHQTGHLFRNFPRVLSKDRKQQGLSQIGKNFFRRKYPSPESESFPSEKSLSPMQDVQTRISLEGDPLSPSQPKISSLLNAISPSMPPLELASDFEVPCPPRSYSPHPPQ